MDVGNGYILKCLYTGCQRAVCRIVMRLQYPLVGFSVAFSSLIVALQHHLRIAKTQVERLQFACTLRTVHIHQLIDKAESGTHGVIVVTTGSLHDNKIGSGMDILPEVLSWGIFDSIDAT